VILDFKFNYISKNGLLENMLESTCKDFGITYKIDRIDNIVSLYVEGDESSLIKFSDFIGSRLPLSIFFKSTSVSVVEKMKDSLKTVEKCEICIPFTPRALLISKENNLNPLVNNEVGLSSFDAKGVLLKDGKEILIDANQEYEELYSKVAKIIKNGEEIHIDSLGGSYIIGNIENLKEDDFLVIPTDLSNVEKMVVIKENEIKALASLEKPAIKLRVNTLYEAKGILPRQRVKVKLADELLLLHICKKLKDEGVDFIYKINKKTSTCRYRLEINGTFKRLPQTEVCVLENGEILILSGDGYSDLVLKNNLKKFETPAHAQFASIVQEHNLFDEKVSCFYLSRTHDDILMNMSEKTGVLDLVKFPIIRDMKSIFETIKDSPIGAKLVQNYKDKFSEIYDEAINCTIENNTPNSMYSIWGITAVILGISNNIKDGSAKIVENAEDFSGKTGPRVDYLLVDKESIRSDFNMMRFIRSSMSFKLAGTDDITLSFGMMEALSYFLSDTSDSYKENLSSQKTLLCGSMFGIKKFTEMACKNIQTNAKICLNRELPIDNETL